MLNTYNEFKVNNPATPDPEKRGADPNPQSVTKFRSDHHDYAVNPALADSGDRAGRQNCAAVAAPDPTSQTNNNNVVAAGGAPVVKIEFTQDLNLAPQQLVAPKSPSSQRFPRVPAIISVRS